MHCQVPMGQRRGALAYKLSYNENVAPLGELLTGTWCLRMICGRGRGDSRLLQKSPIIPRTTRGRDRRVARKGSTSPCPGSLQISVQAQP